MSKSKAHEQRPSPTPLAEEKKRGPVETWMRFWFTPTDPLGLHVVRVLGCLLFLIWLLPLATSHEAFFGLNGWVSLDVFEKASAADVQSPVPLERWSIFYLCGESSGLLSAAYWGSVAVIVLFGLGIAPRLTGVLTWVAVLSCTANPIITTDVDVLMVIFAFYLMLGYLLMGHRQAPQSTLTRILGPTRETWLFGRSSGTERSASIGANVAVRLLQIHFALVIVMSALHKLSVGEWWAGWALWYPLHPPFGETVVQIHESINSFGPQSYFFLLSLGTYVILGWQLCFPLFAWRKGMFRWLLIGGASIGFLGAAFLYAQSLFGLALFVGCLSFLRPEEWQSLLQWTKQVLQKVRSKEPSPAPKQEPVKLAV